jgi:hypothetical protein
MENIQAPQNGTTSQTEQPAIQETFRKTLFPTELRCYSYPITQDMIDAIVEMANKANETSDAADIMSLDHPVIEQFKDFVFDICQELDEFKLDGPDGSNRTRNIPINEKLNYLPNILGSNVLFQQPKEHIPLHCYEFVPLVFTFVLNTGGWPPITYYADTRGGVQTIRQLAAQDLVGTSYGLKAKIGEVIITPGYLQRYTETNLSDQTQVFLNIKVGFAGY